MLAHNKQKCVCRDWNLVHTVPTKKEMELLDSFGNDDFQMLKAGDARMMMKEEKEVDCEKVGVGYIFDEGKGAWRCAAYCVLRVRRDVFMFIHE